VEDSDDDGEARAGIELLRALRKLRVTGVAVVVGRWWSGNIGKARFVHIRERATSLLLACGAGTCPNMCQLQWNTEGRRVGSGSSSNSSNSSSSTSSCGRDGNTVDAAAGEVAKKSPILLSSQNDGSAAVKRSRREMFALAAEARLAKRSRVEEVQPQKMHEDKAEEKIFAASPSTNHDHISGKHNVVVIIDDDDEEEETGRALNVHELSELGGLPYVVIKEMLRENNDDTDVVRQLLLSKILGT
jgi:hypothetical protein